MRAVVLSVAFACLLTAVAGHAEPKFPCELTAPAAGVTLRSGPGPTFYATDRLPPGARLEIHREENGGWLAVRPPQGSFSVVERRQLKPGKEPGVAVVLAEDVLCCVGSRVEAVQAYVSQVRLRKEELVELLDKWDDHEASGADSADLSWCRISPPAGEFRWVHADDLKSTASITAESPVAPATAGQTPATAPKTSFEADGWQARPANPAATPKASPVAPSQPVDTGQGWIQPPSAAANAAAAPKTSPVVPSQPVNAGQGWTPSPSAAKRESGNGPVAGPTEPKTKSAVANPIRVPVDGEKLIVGPATEKRAATAEPPRAASLPTTPAAEAITPAPSAPATPVPQTSQWTSRTPPPRQTIDELELALSMAVAGDMQEWRLADLRQRVEANLVRYESTAERVQARRLLDRIAEFEQLQSRVAQATQQPAPTASSLPAPAATNAAPSDAIPSAAAGVKYDGSGWLVPVHSATGTAPPFALLDTQGEVLGYVSPTPGLNLQRYLRKQVGIFGQRGYVQSLNKPHVTAERVVDLDRHLR